MRIKNTKTGYFYIGFDSRLAEPVWTNIKCQTSNFTESEAEVIIRQLAILGIATETQNE